MKDINSVSFYWFMVLLSIVILIVSAYLAPKNIMIEILYFGSFISAVIFLYLIECKNGK